MMVSQENRRTISQMSFLYPIKKNNSKATAIYGLASFCLFVISHMISGAVETSKWVSLIRIAVITVSCVCYLLCFYSTDSIENYRRQLSWINVCNLVYQILLCIVTFRTVIYIRYYSQIYLEVLWILVTLHVLWKSYKVLDTSLSNLKNEENRFYVVLAGILALILIILSYDVDGPHIVWDANSLYSRLNELELTDIFDLSKFFIFAHLSVSYFYPIFLLGNLVRELAWGYWIYNAVCIVAVSYGVVFILKKTLFDRSRLFVTISSIACLFSPFVCGISTYYTYDYALCCLTPCLILFALDKDWIYFMFMAVYISLIKEPGIIIVGSVCAGIILVDVIYDKVSIRNSLFRIRTLCEIFVAVQFFVFFKMYSFYESTVEAYYGFDKEHAIAVLKYFLIMNYEWVVILLTLVLLVITLLRRERISKYILLYAFPAVSLLFFYIIFVCEEYVRYTEAFPICMLLIMVTLLSVVDMKEYIRCGISAAMAILMLGSSFYSFDPVSKRVMITENIGNSDLYFARQGFDFGGDPHIYNRQYYGLDIVFDKALRKAINSGDELIAVSNGNNRRTWAMDGGIYAYDESDGKRIFTEFWNIKKDTRDPVYDYKYIYDPEFIPLNLRYIFPGDDIVDALSGCETFIYIYMPSQNNGRENTVREHFEILEEGNYSSHGWVLSYIRGR